MHKGQAGNGYMSLINIDSNNPLPSPPLFAHYTPDKQSPVYKYNSIIDDLPIQNGLGNGIRGRTRPCRIFQRRDAGAVFL